MAELFRRRLRITGMLAITTFIPVVAFAQTAATASATAPTFAVAAIRQVFNPPSSMHNSIDEGGKSGNFTASDVPLKMFLGWAYDIPETRILGLPSALSTLYFNIEAKSDPSVDAQMSQMTSEQARQQKRQMLQALLADRFKVTLHQETRELPVYALVVAKGGPKFAPSKADGTTINQGKDHIQVRGSDDTVALLAAALAKNSEVDRVVLDKTGITGRFDITLTWTPDTATPSADSGPSIFTALQEQLGLKLESTKAPVEVLVVDHVEMPSAN
jgi:uncharacterized protein (TIGR03435 family)